MKLEVHKVNQMASGGSFVAIYGATIDFTSEQTSVVVDGVEPPDADRTLVDRAAASILRGARRALEPIGLGAAISINRLVIHPDFKESAFERYTLEEVARLANEKAESGRGDGIAPVTPPTPPGMRVRTGRFQ